MKDLLLKKSNKKHFLAFEFVINTYLFISKDWSDLQLASATFACLIRMHPDKFEI